MDFLKSFGFILIFFILDVGVGMNDQSSGRSAQCEPPCLPGKYFDATFGINFFNQDVASDEGMQLKIIVKPKINSDGHSGKFFFILFSLNAEMINYSFILKIASIQFHSFQL